MFRAWLSSATLRFSSLAEQCYTQNFYLRYFKSDFDVVFIFYVVFIFEVVLIFEVVFNLILVNLSVALLSQAENLSVASLIQLQPRVLSNDFHWLF